MSEPTEEQILASIKQIITDGPATGGRVRKSCGSSSCGQAFALLVGIVIGAVGYSFYGTYLHQASITANEEAVIAANTAELTAAQTTGPLFFELPSSVVVMPQASADARPVYVKVSVSAEAGDAASRSQLEANKPILEDSVRNIVMIMPIEKIQSPEGVEALRAEILADWRAKVPQANIKAILLRDMIWQ